MFLNSTFRYIFISYWQAICKLPKYGEVYIILCLIFIHILLFIGMLNILHKFFSLFFSELCWERAMVAYTKPQQRKEIRA